MSQRIIYNPGQPNRRFDNEGDIILPGEVFKVSDERADELLERHPEILKLAPSARGGQATSPDSSISAQPISSGTAPVESKGADSK